MDDSGGYYCYGGGRSKMTEVVTGEDGLFLEERSLWESCDGGWRLEVRRRGCRCVDGGVGGFGSGRRGGG